MNKNYDNFLLLIKPLKSRHDESRTCSILSLGSASILSACLCTLLSFNVQAQWIADTMGTVSGGYGVEGTVKVTSTAGSVAGDNNYQGLIVTDPNFDNQVRIDQAFNSIPTANLFKATAGEPFTITLEISHKYILDIPGNPGVPSTNQVFQEYFVGDAWDTGNTLVGSIRALRGEEEQAELYDDDVMLNKDLQYEAVQVEPNVNLFNRKSIFSHEFTFPTGTERGWIVMGFVEKSVTIYNQNRYTNLIILPFVVEGPKLTMTADDPVPILGYFKDPAIPQLILHNPPGDLSTVTLETSEETCRSISQSLTSDGAAASRFDITAGIAYTGGIIVAVDFEFTATVSSSAGGGSSEMTSNGVNNCLKVVNTIGTAAGLAPANEGSIYMGYSSQIAYGEFPVVRIAEDLTISTGTEVIFGLVPNSATPFYYSKNDILNEMEELQATVDDPATLDKVRHEAGSQIDIWEQVLEKDSANIMNPDNVVIQNEFTITGGSGVNMSSSTLSLTSTSDFEVSHFIEQGASTSFIANVGGSGVAGGTEFKTKKTFGGTVSNSNNTSTTISYNLQDNDAGDQFRIKIVKDPTYGTPIFLLNSELSRSSWPYEGGYQRDQPIFEIVGTISDSINIPNVSLGTSGSFKVRACNGNVFEARDYDFGFLGQTVSTDLKITSAGSEGNQLPSLPITKFLKITGIPAGGCKASQFDVNMSRRDAGSEMAYSDIEFQLFAENEPNINSSVFASINWAGPSPPTGVSVSSPVVCDGVSAITLMATCPVSTTTTWYDVITGGFAFAVGGSVVVKPTSTTTYYVGCETPDYRRDRVGVEVNCEPSPDMIFENGFEPADN